jgi:hypothetical protein
MPEAEIKEELEEFQTREAYLSFDLINVKYNIYKEPREEKEKVIVRTRPRLYSVRKI